jgi:redox-regulated HSP33 family molecular chaperone
MIGEVPAVNLNGELQELLSEATRLFSQLNTFISQFHNFVNETGINVVTDGYGSLGVDVVESVSDATAQGYANRINVFDSLIHDRVHTIEELIGRISDLELQIIQSDNDYTSQLPQLRARLANLVRSYGHIHS